MADLSSQQWTIIRDCLAARCGLYLDDSRQNQGLGMAQKRIKVLGLTAAAYTALVQTSAGATELRELAEQLANHETQFFRNPAHFRLLQSQILPELHRLRPPMRSLRIWSAGCATGEEPYGIAITALETLGHPLERPVRIWGTDLSGAALDRARAGVYRGRSLANLHPTQRRWFGEHGAGLQVGTTAQSLVQFEQHNLLDPFPGWAMDLDIVFCQNVTIYFQLATCKELIARIYDAMAEGGYLFLGFSETLWGIFDRFETVECEGAFLYRKNSRLAAPSPR
ncbi:MAG TPA: CheR family methyltransferase, partial [Herpetosiphonaceae bacterium]